VETPSVEVFVNEDINGDSVGIILVGATLIEEDEQIRPVLELSPACAMKLAEALVECAGQIVRGLL
jgi:hypothetical protein